MDRRFYQLNETREFRYLVLRDDTSRFNRESAKKNETTKGLRLGSSGNGIRIGKRSRTSCL